MKEISIIIATFNASKTLARCLDSIVKQKTSEIELIIIDGGSKDNTVEIIKGYEDDSIDYMVSEQDKGIYDAWNKGIMIASGRWIMFIGADDQLEDDALSSYLDFIESHDTTGVDIISAIADVVDNNGSFLYKMGNPYKWKEFRKSFEISHGSTLHNKQLFDEVGLFDISYKICADYELLLRKKLNALFLEKKTFIMQDGGMSTTTEALYDAFRAKRQHNSQSYLGALFLLYRAKLGVVLRNIFPALKKFK